MYLRNALQLTLTSALLSSPSTSPNSPSSPAETPELSQEQTQPGYSPNTPSTVSGIPHFGQKYAALNLDLINGLVGDVNETEAGKRWIDATASWITAYLSHSILFPISPLTTE